MFSMNLSVQTFKSKILLEVNANTTVGDLKEQIATEEGIDVSHFEVTHCGDVLVDMKKMVLSLGVDGGSEFEIYRSKKSIAITNLNGVVPTGDRLFEEIASGGSQIATIIDAGVSVNYRDSYGITPLMAAVVQGNVDAVDLLLEKGAAINATDSYQMGPIQHALELDDQKAIQILTSLLQHGANPNFKCRGTSPMHMAAAKASSAILQFLLQNGGNPEAKDHMGETALHKAIRFQRGSRITKILVDNGGGLNAVNSRSETPLHLAMMFSTDSDIEFMLQAGADPTITNADKQTPESLARSIGREVAKVSEFTLTAHNKDIAAAC
eukprot:TRINITY_DN28354_c0_g1_i1.p1 TRINITY_DN28354_c0_g1~~TRINITY_DN28354_c0_g1_i1.p1  ORF type:complete len:354 (+),score=94.00 TRINITY_DN28354_c0_g1_i1:91-1062(+)